MFATSPSQRRGLSITACIVPFTDLFYLLYVTQTQDRKIEDDDFPKFYGFPVEGSDRTLSSHDMEIVWGGKGFCTLVQHE